jgi:hypothetical protein
LPREFSVNQVARWLIQNVELPPVALIPAVREIGGKGSSQFSGGDIIRRLAELQNPPIHEQHKKQQFSAIREFIRAVTGDDGAEIEIPVGQDTIHVRLGSQTLPLENLGTGIHKVTMFAAWATSYFSGATS